MTKQTLVKAMKSALPLVFGLALVAVCAHAQMPLDRYSANASQVTNSQILRRIAGVAVMMLGLVFAMKSHDANKGVVIGVLFGIAVALNADTIVGWMA